MQKTNTSQAKYESEEPTNKALIYRSLQGYANWIETDDFILSATDFVNMGKKPKVLSEEQKQLVKRLRDLAVKELMNNG